MAHTFFGTDGIRGTVGQAPITPDFVLRLGHAVGRVLKRSDRLLEGLVKGHMPNIFRERVDVNANVTGGVLVAPAGVAPVDWQKQFGALAHGPLPDTKEYFSCRLGSVGRATDS